MKIALIQDQLLIKGGSERIFQYMVEEFPEADIYTSAYNPLTTWPEFKKYTIRTTWTNYFIRNHDHFKNFYPLLTFVFQYLDLSGYQVILSSSATVAKYISRFNGTHICYCYFPTRAIWNTDAYFSASRKSIKVAFFRALLPLLKRHDIAAAKRVDKFIAISEYTSHAIAQFYDRKSEILCCPIDFDHFRQGNTEEKGNHYLIVSRLEHWKRVDYAIDAFNSLGLPLRIVGAGAEGSTMKRMAGDNIEFLGNIDDVELVKEYGRAKAVIFTPEMEYSLVPLEANAAGTPVIAYGKGGIAEIMHPFSRNAHEGEFPTAIFFYEQSPTALIAAIREFERMSFDREALVRHAEEYSVPSFKKALRKYVEESAGESKYRQYVRPSKQ
jgi:glycosyltransferase involved in cell wall biosynthesis